MPYKPLNPFNPNSPFPQQPDSFKSFVDGNRHRANESASRRHGQAAAEAFRHMQGRNREYAEEQLAAARERAAHAGLAAGSPTATPTGVLVFGAVAMVVIGLLLLATVALSG